MSSHHFDVRGLNNLNSKLKKFVPEKEKKIEEKLIDFVTEVNAAQVTRAPIDTGYMRQHTFWTRVGKLQFAMFSAAPYAPFVEFGTGGLVDVPAGLEKYAVQFKGRGIRVVNLPPRPFFFPPFLERKKQLAKEIDAML